MNRTNKLMMMLLAAALLIAAGPAQAQDSPPPAAPPPATSTIGGGPGAGIGVGAAVTLADTTFGQTKTFTANFVYDMAILHIEGLLGFTSFENNAGDRVTDWLFGAGGWYHFHRGASSDFSLGALIAINTTSGPGQSRTVTAFEPGAQVRAFVTPNVAIFARAGLAFLFGDTGSGTDIALGGQATGAFGFSYFFR